MMENPTIKLKGKTYTAPAPKVKLWREVTKFKEKFSDTAQGDQEALSEMERLIAAAFNNPDITAEVIEEEMDLDEFVPLFYQIAGWVAEVVSRKMRELPNGLEPADRT